MKKQDLTDLFLIVPEQLSPQSAYEQGYTKGLNTQESYMNSLRDCLGEFHNLVDNFEDIYLHSDNFKNKMKLLFRLSEKAKSLLNKMP